MKIATWNVNSLRARLPNVLAWLAEARPDVVCLQEIKTEAAGFPELELKALGYQIEVLGQKSYNGVALLSRLPMTDVLRGLPGDASDEQARYLEATIAGVRIASIYLPNGNPVGTDKYPYKLAWMERLIVHARSLLATEIPFVLAGDYNICPTDDDVYDPVGWRDDALCRPESRARFRHLLNLGLTDAFRALHPEPHRYTFWDYQAGRWFRDEGLRIDHFLLSPRTTDRLIACEIDREPRGKEKASDHTVIWCEIQD
ncbi:MAG TPA: exodeoxyribonuclease III [Stellaceae bacterium]|nr:exodeoxyribonuclease III [Stellaceae bacterium]